MSDSSSKSATATLRPILGFIRPYLLRLSLAVIALVVVAGLSLLVGQAVKQVIDEGFVAQSQAQLTHSLLLLTGIILLIAIGTFVRFYLMSWLGERVSADIRQAVFNRLVVLHPSYFEENQSGEIMSRLTTDTTLLQSIIGSSLSMALRNTLTLLGGLVMLFITNVKLSFMVLSGVPLAILPMLFFGRRVRTLARKSQDTVADVGSYAGEVIQNIKVVQSYTQEQQERLAFAREVDSAFDVARRRIRQRALLIAAVIILVFSGICAMLWVGGTDVLAGHITAGELGAFVFYALMVSMSLGTLSEVYGELQRAAGAAERLMELLAVTSQITTPGSALPIAINKNKPALRLNQVTFAYPSRPATPALRNFTLQVNEGETVALVGPSGAGKSTLFELLERFYDPQQGSIELYGTPLTHIEVQAARRFFGLVPQQPVLFSANVWHNIRYGNPDSSDEQVVAAATQAHAHEFIQSLPDGYQSYLGEKGVRLSGGQKQRIAIARAILNDPPILLLDEATSALDAESEHFVQTALQQLMVSRTTLIIAHRLATVIHADRIVVMDSGEIVATGTHESLQKESPLYQRLCKLQFSG